MPLVAGAADDGAGTGADAAGAAGGGGWTGEKPTRTIH